MSYWGVKRKRLAEKVKKEKPTKKELEETAEASKSDIIGFQGGLSVKLDKKLKSTGENLRTKLSLELGQWLDDEIENQSARIENIGKWQRMYRGQRPPKNIPYPKCSNVAVPISRINTEAISVRVMDGFWSQPKFWIVQPKKEEFAEFAPILEDDMDWWQKSVVGLRKKLFSPLMQAIKTGTGIIKMEHVSRTRSISRYATEEEAKNPNIKTFKFANGQPGIKEVVTTFEGPDIFPISREDFVISSDATSIQDACFIGFKKYLKKPDIEVRVRQGLFDKDEAKKLKLPDEIDETKQDRAEEQGKKIPPNQRDKFEIWEIWMRYDVDEDGEEDDIVITFHPETRTILRCIYNPIFNGFRPFIDLVFNPTEYCFDGEGTCEILETLQVEIDTLHNTRNDRLAQLNSPILFYNKSAFGEGGLELIPGLHHPTDANPSEVLYEFKFSDQTYSTVLEEQLLVDYANKATGVTPDVLGQPTSSRPVFKEMASRLQEANKKFKFGIDNLRQKGAEIGMMYIEMSAQYQPVHSFFVKDGQKMTQKTVNYPLEYLRDGINVTLAASSELMNQESRRETAMQKYQMLSDYYTKLAGMVQAMVSPMVPPPFKMFVIRATEIAEKLMEDVLRDMDTLNPDDLVMNMMDIFGEEGLMQAMQPPPPMPQPGGPSGGQPGQGGPPQPGPPPGPPPQGPPMGM